jgi:putative two-component system response regulator
MAELASRPATVLVADDQEANVELLLGLLEVEGYHVVCATDGQQALEVLKTQEIDVVLLDVMMPGRTGFEVCREIKADAATRLIPVVLVTALDSSDDRIKGIDCGADDFLNKPVDRAELLARVRSLVRLKQFTDELENAETVLFSLAISIEAKDPYTEGHCHRLSAYAVALAERLGVNGAQRIALRRGGVVHDVGKVVVPELILQKPGPLTPAERKIMERHPIVGERICAPLKSFRHVLPILRHHHEKMDGSGYPDGLKGDQIPITARILTAVDIYDALTTDRPYRKALPQEQAFAIMHQEVKRGWWDPCVVNELERALTAAGPSSVGNAV